MAMGAAEQKLADREDGNGAVSQENRPRFRGEPRRLLVRLTLGDPSSHSIEDGVDFANNLLNRVRGFSLDHYADGNKETHDR